MRIVHIINYFMNGFGYQEEYLARLHTVAGHDVHVLTSARAYPRHRDYASMADVYPSRRLPPSVERDGFTVHRLPIAVEANTQTVLRGSMTLLSALDPELVVMHGLARLETIRVLQHRGRSSSRYRLIVDDHSLYSVYQATIARRAYYAAFRSYLRRYIDRIDRLIAVSEETARFLVDVFGISEELIEIIPLGADTELFQFDANARKRTRRALCYGIDDFVILYAGKVTEAKGVGTLYDAALPLLKRAPNAALLIVGSGWKGKLGQHIVERAHTDGIGAQILLRPHVPHNELPGYYSACDVAVWPAQATMAALEVASCGRPVILSGSSVARERTAGGNGFACTTTEEVTAALNRLHDSPTLRRTMGAAGARFVRERYSWESVAERFLASSAERA